MSLKWQMWQQAIYSTEKFKYLPGKSSISMRDSIILIRIHNFDIYSRITALLSIIFKYLQPPPTTADGLESLELSWSLWFIFVFFIVPLNKRKEREGLINQTFSNFVISKNWRVLGIIFLMTLKLNNFKNENMFFEMFI